MKKLHRQKLVTVGLLIVAVVATVEFQKSDVVRHPLVQRIIGAYEQHRAKNHER